MATARSTSYAVASGHTLYAGVDPLFTLALDRVIADGNSLVFGQGASSGAGAFPAQLAGLDPLLNTGIVVSNLGISGQTTQQMIDSAADVNGAWDGSKRNTLLVWEGTNSIVGGRTALQAASDMTAYIAARRAAHAWRSIILLTTLPRRGGAGDPGMPALNAALISYDDYLRTNYRDMGADRLVDVRKVGSPFYTTDFNEANFIAWQNTSGLWFDEAHLNAAGYAIVAQYCAEALKTL